MNEKAPIIEKKPESEGDKLLASLSKLSEDNKTLTANSAKTKESLDKLVVFHNKTVTEMKAKHDGQLSKIREAVKDALLNDHE